MTVKRGVWYEAKDILGFGGFVRGRGWNRARKIMMMVLILNSGQAE